MQEADTIRIKANRGTVEHREILEAFQCEKCETADALDAYFHTNGATGPGAAV